MAVLSQLRGPGGDSSTAHAAAAAAAAAAVAAGTTAAAQPGETGTSKGPSAATTGSNNSLSKGSSSGATKVPFAYSLQLFDTAGAKEVTWGAAYKLVAEAAGGSDGRALLPAVQLQPGKYLVVLQLQPGVCQQWVDPVTGATEPAPSWQLSLLPSADEKACPIVKDDAYERHFKGSQQQLQAVGALQGQQAAEFTEWRSRCQVQQQAVASRKLEVLSALAPAVDPALLIAAAPAAADSSSRKQNGEKGSGKGRG
ncbi:hypothetical protein OEZ85_012201 [Tetradesmus obliquus]|uniref:FAP42-like domain-containing protein n=1 Tax=Tetradesmus obliquus TaxID=3088 RepID=A0ABY8TUQ7_TETOB|nr:hypothetical protein OEZ85_012201 [Tetradesmus obliquus]